MSAWSKDQKELAVSLYKEICENEYETDELRAENATAIVEQVAEQIEGKTVNGTRLILNKAGVYIAQKPKTAPAKAGGAAKSGAAKLSKADQIQALKDTIRDSVTEGVELDDTILDKLTGKAAAHFTDLFLATQGE